MTMRKPIIVGNWKMNKTIAQTKAFVEAVDGACTDKADWGIATPYLALQTAKGAAKNLIVAAQNCHFKDSGAYTGEVSVSMLKEIGVEWVILGHSERRQYFGETDETVNAKMRQVLSNDLTPIVCVGETLEEYEAGTTKDVVKTQTVAAFKDVLLLLMNQYGLLVLEKLQLMKSLKMFVHILEALLLNYMDRKLLIK